MVPIANSGSMIIYHRVIKPFLKKHEKELDAAFDVAGAAVKDAAGKGKKLIRYISVYQYSHLVGRMQGDPPIIMFIG